MCVCVVGDWVWVRWEVERGRIVKYLNLPVNLEAWWKHQKIDVSRNIQAFIGLYFVTFVENFLIKDTGRVLWLIPIIPALWERPRWVDHKVRSLRPAWPTWWNPISTKIQKINQALWHAPVVPTTQEVEAGEITWSQEMEVAVSQDCAIALQPGDRARLCLKIYICIYYIVCWSQITALFLKTLLYTVEILYLYFTFCHTEY